MGLSLPASLEKGRNRKHWASRSSALLQAEEMKVPVRMTQSAEKKVYPHQNGDNKLQNLQAALSCSHCVSLHPCLWQPVRNAAVVLQSIPHLHSSVKERCCLSRAVSDPSDSVAVLTTDTPWGILISWPWASTLLCLNAGHICLWWVCDKTWVAVIE